MQIWILKKKDLKRLWDVTLVTLFLKTHKCNKKGSTGNKSVNKHIRDSAQTKNKTSIYIGDPGVYSSDFIQITLYLMLINANV